MHRLDCNLRPEVALFAGAWVDAEEVVVAINHVIAVRRQFGLANKSQREQSWRHGHGKNR